MTENNLVIAPQKLNIFNTHNIIPNLILAIYGKIFSKLWKNNKISAFLILNVQNLVGKENTINQL